MPPNMPLAEPRFTHRAPVPYSAELVSDQYFVLYDLSTLFDSFRIGFTSQTGKFPLVDWLSD